MYYLETARLQGAVETKIDNNEMKHTIKMTIMCYHKKIPLK